jgi:RNA polymerase sigma-70 factor (ECF subfamily)
VAAPDLHLDDALDSDDALVERIRRGDEAAFERLYDRYFPRVYAFLSRRLRQREDTEETAQQVFVNVFSAIGSYRGDAPFAAWVFGLTRRTLANRFRRKRHATVPLAEEDDDAMLVESVAIQREPDPHEQYEYRERLKRMNRAANELSEEQWRLFLLHHLQNLSIQEIAATLRKSEDAIKSNLYRARKALLAR